MKNKHLEEFMIRYAYGELEDHEVALAEQMVASSAEASRLYDIYSVASSGTKSLPEPPTPQLSKERLREAILSKEIKTVGARAWSWIGFAAPTAAALALAIYVFLPERTAQSPVAERVIAEQDNRPAPPAFTSGPQIIERPAEGTKTVTEPKPEKSVSKPAAKRSAAPPATRFAASGVATAEHTEPVFETVVLINAGPSSADGTRDATELGHTTDVSFGN